VRYDLARLHSFQLSKAFQFEQEEEAQPGDTKYWAGKILFVLTQKLHRSGQLKISSSSSSSSSRAEDFFFF